MLLYCLMCKKDTKNVNSKVSKTSNERIIFLWKCTMCNSKKLKFMKEQEGSWFLIQSGIIVKYHYWVIFYFRELQKVIVMIIK